jgi:hypothetical protein
MEAQHEPKGPNNAESFESWDECVETARALRATQVDAEADVLYTTWRLAYAALRAVELGRPGVNERKTARFKAFCEEAGLNARTIHRDRDVRESKAILDVCMTRNPLISVASRPTPTSRAAISLPSKHASTASAANF